MRAIHGLVLLALLLAVLPASANVVTAAYGVTACDSVIKAFNPIPATDSFVAASPLVCGAKIIDDIEIPHRYESQTADFYLIMFLCLMLGMIRYFDTRYFFNLWRAFWNPTLSSRQLRDQLEGSAFPDLMMNIFFTFSAGAYIYYIVKYFTPHHTGVIPPSLLIIMLVAGTALIYLAKYAAVRFSGWAFRVEGITNHYLFNVFLINKVLGIMLVPFIIILAFADHSWATQVVIVSFIIAGVLLLNRYLRSWQVFGTFFQYSKFHFFLYLCASELLPLAILMKLLVKGLMFY